jgi:hypothetical protein
LFAKWTNRCKDHERFKNNSVHPARNFTPLSGKFQQICGKWESQGIMPLRVYNALDAN